MFWTALGEVLTVALVIAVNPPAIIAVILVLLGPHPRAGGLLFVLGSVIAVLAMVGIAYLLTEAADESGDVGDEIDVLSLLLGLLFLGFAAAQWRARPAPGEPAQQPKALARVETMAPPALAGLGFATTLLNFKTIPLAVGAGARLSQTGIEGGAATAAILAVTIIGSLGVLIPVMAVLAGGERVRAPLQAFKDWLLDNLAAIVIVVCLLVGANFIGQGLGLLA